MITSDESDSNTELTNDDDDSTNESSSSTSRSGDPDSKSEKTEGETSCTEDKRAESVANARTKYRPKIEAIEHQNTASMALEFESLNKVSTNGDIKNTSRETLKDVENITSKDDETESDTGPITGEIEVFLATKTRSCPNTDKTRGGETSCGVRLDGTGGFDSNEYNILRQTVSDELRARDSHEIFKSVRKANPAKYVCIKPSSSAQKQESDNSESDFFDEEVDLVETRDKLPKLGSVGRINSIDKKVGILEPLEKFSQSSCESQSSHMEVKRKASIRTRSIETVGGITMTTGSISTKSVAFSDIATMAFFEKERKAFYYFYYDIPTLHQTTETPEICPYKFLAMFNDEAFVDYFNVFLQQPVFGQHALYRQNEGDFVFDPPLPPYTHDHECLAQDRAFDWCRIFRYPLYINTDLYLDYCLSCLLRIECVSSYTSYTPSDNIVEVKGVEQLLNFLLGHVVGMQSFRQSMSDTDGRMIYPLWIHLERYRITPMDSQDRQNQEENIKRKYLASKSEKHIPSWREKLGVAACLKFNIIPEEANLSQWQIQELVEDKTEPYSDQQQHLFSQLQRVILLALKMYWLPRYIVHILSSNKESVLMNCFRCESAVDPTFANIRAHFMTIFQAACTPEDSTHKLRMYQDHDQLSLEILANKVESEHIRPFHLIELSGGLFKEGQKLAELVDNEIYQKEERNVPLHPAGLTKSGEYYFSTCFKRVPSAEGALLRTNETDKDSYCANELRHKIVSRKCKSAPVYTDYGAKWVKTIPSPNNLSLTISYYLNGGKNEATIYQEDAPHLVSAIASDDLSGSPFAIFLYNDDSYSSFCTLQMYQALHDLRYIPQTDRSSYGTNLKQQKSTAIVDRFLLSNSSEQTCMSHSLCSDLKYHLMSGDYEIVPYAQEECCRLLVEDWKKYWNEDRELFLRLTCFGDLGNFLYETENLLLRDPNIPSVGEFAHNNPSRRAFELAIGCTDRGEFYQNCGLTNFISMRQHDLGSILEPKDTREHIKYDENIKNIIKHKFPSPVDLSDSKLDARSNYLRYTLPNWAYPEKQQDKTINEVIETMEAGNKWRRKGLKRPKSFGEVLRDIHLRDDFALFLKHKALLDLQFILDVQMAKSILNAPKLNMRLDIIHKKYFSRKANHGRNFDCKADILRALGSSDHTASIIVYSRAQAEVFHHLQNIWFPSYYVTFEGKKDDVYVAKVWQSKTSSKKTVIEKYEATESESETRKVEKRAITTNDKWKMYVKIIITFIRTINKSLLRRLFQLYILNELRQMGVQGKADKEPIPEVTVFAGNKMKVILNRIPADLELWLEILRYKYMFTKYIPASTPVSDINLRDCDNLRRKAFNIIECFYRSDVQPTLRVNISQDMAAATINTVDKRFPIRGLFHDAAMTLFLPVYSYWQKFMKDWRPPVKKPRNVMKMLHAKYQLVKPRLCEASPHTSKVFPDYTDTKRNDIVRIRDPDSHCINLLQFSLAAGTRVVVPIKQIDHAYAHTQRKSSFLNALTFSDQNSDQQKKYVPHQFQSINDSALETFAAISRREIPHRRRSMLIDNIKRTIEARVVHQKSDTVPKPGSATNVKVRAVRKIQSATCLPSRKTFTDSIPAKHTHSLLSYHDQKQKDLKRKTSMIDSLTQNRSIFVIKVPVEKSAIGLGTRKPSIVATPRSIYYQREAKVSLMNAKSVHGEKTKTLIAEQRKPKVEISRKTYSTKKPRSCMKPTKRRTSTHAQFKRTERRYSKFVCDSQLQEFLKQRESPSARIAKSQMKTDSSPVAISLTVPSICSSAASPNIRKSRSPQLLQSFPTSLSTTPKRKISDEYGKLAYDVLADMITIDETMMDVKFKKNQLKRQSMLSKTSRISRSAQNEKPVIKPATISEKIKEIMKPKLGYRTTTPCESVQLPEAIRDISKQGKNVQKMDVTSYRSIPGGVSYKLSDTSSDVNYKMRSSSSVTRSPILKRRQQNQPRRLSAALSTKRHEGGAVNLCIDQKSIMSGSMKKVTKSASTGGIGGTDRCNSTYQQRHSGTKTGTTGSKPLVRKTVYVV